MSPHGWVLRRLRVPRGGPLRRGEALVLGKVADVPLALDREAFHRRLRRRQDRRRPTILLGNVEPKVFWARFDSRTRDRLRVCAFVRGLTGDSMRAPRRKDGDAR